MIVAPLTPLCSPKFPFVWTTECQQAFESAKSLLFSASVLAAANFSVPFKLEVDTSAFGAGAVLLQVDANGIPHPVCLISTKFKKHQLNYSTIEKEILTMLLALQHFEVYVGYYALPVTWYINHNPLLYLKQMYNHNQCRMRCSSFAQSNKIEILHKCGADNVVADLVLG